ncbi:DoxX family protein [Bacillus sp. RG28]|uniref:DoxX family protein n=1 Tax=Gottfriedia endophytica TaxID=2820819 RepID=A0A940NL14_9BACI|nr:DoxX family protein [Gottfriedia endophytica]MBP0726400.1 DoxX family protein [Gottfriedia endophytica]
MSVLSIVLQSLLVLYYIVSGVAKIAGAKYWTEMFDHLKLSQGFRVFTGFFQLVGAIVLIIGYWYTGLIAWGAIWLGISMLIALIVHLRVKDPFSKNAPSLFFLIINIILIIINTKDMMHPFS